MEKYRFQVDLWDRLHPPGVYHTWPPQANWQVEASTAAAATAFKLGTCKEKVINFDKYQPSPPPEKQKWPNPVWPKDQISLFVPVGPSVPSNKSQRRQWHQQHSPDSMPFYGKKLNWYRSGRSMNTYCEKKATKQATKWLGRWWESL